jgi:uncharacterized membrane protein
MRCLLGDALGRVGATGIVLQIAELGIGLLVGNVIVRKRLLGRNGLALLLLLFAVVAAAASGTFVVTRGGRARTGT